MENKITVREWIVKLNNGYFDAEDFNTQCNAGWYDWFCKESSLKNKTKKIGSIIKDITNDFILDNFYVWFKNNCPCVGSLYDDFRFEPINEEDNYRDKIYFGVACDDDRNEHKYEIFTARNGYKKELVADNKTELIKIINQLGSELESS